MRNNLGFSTDTYTRERQTSYIIVIFCEVLFKNSNCRTAQTRKYQIIAESSKYLVIEIELERIIAI